MFVELTLAYFGGCLTGSVGTRMVLKKAIAAANKAVSDVKAELNTTIEKVQDLVKNHEALHVENESVAQKNRDLYELNRQLTGEVANLAARAKPLPVKRAPAKKAPPAKKATKPQAHRTVS
jgi:chromosome segregation ATPase